MQKDRSLPLLFKNRSHSSKQHLHSTDERGTQSKSPVPRLKSLSPKKKPPGINTPINTDSATIEELPSSDNKKNTPFSPRKLLLKKSNRSKNSRPKVSTIHKPYSIEEIEQLRKTHCDYVINQSLKILASSNKKRIIKQLIDQESPQILYLFFEYKQITKKPDSTVKLTSQPFLDYFIEEYHGKEQTYEKFIAVFYIGIMIEMNAAQTAEHVHSLLRQSWVMRLMSRVDELSSDKKTSLAYDISQCINRAEPGWPHYYDLTTGYPKLYDISPMSACTKLITDLLQHYLTYQPSIATQKMLFILYGLLFHESERLLKLIDHTDHNDSPIPDHHQWFAVKITGSVLWLRLLGPVLYPGMREQSDEQEQQVIKFISQQFSNAVTNMSCTDILLKKGHGISQTQKAWYQFMDKELSPYLRYQLFSYLVTLIKHKSISLTCLNTCNPLILNEQWCSLPTLIPVLTPSEADADYYYQDESLVNIGEYKLKASPKRIDARSIFK